MKLYKTLRDYRKQNNLLQKQIAAKIGISREYYSRIEEHRAFPSIQLLHRMASKLHLKITVAFPLHDHVSFK